MSSIKNNIRVYVPDSGDVTAFHPFHILFLEGLKHSNWMVFYTIIAVANRDGTPFTIDFKDIGVKADVSERSVYRTVTLCISLGYLLKSGGKGISVYELDLRKVREDAEASDRWRDHRSDYKNIFQPFVAIPRDSEERPKPVRVVKMAQDISEIGKSKVKKAHEANKVTKEYREESVKGFYKELSPSCLDSFKSLFGVLKFTEGSETLFTFVQHIRKLNNPHLISESRFKQTLDNFVCRLQEGGMHSDHVMKKRNILIKWLKNLKRPQYANMIQGCPEKIANIIAGQPNFNVKLKALFAADQDQNYPYRKHLWHVIERGTKEQSVPYLPTPYTEDYLYNEYKIYSEVHK